MDDEGNDNELEGFEERVGRLMDLINADKTKSAEIYNHARRRMRIFQPLDKLSQQQVNYFVNMFGIAVETLIDQDMRNGVAEPDTLDDAYIDRIKLFVDECWELRKDDRYLDDQGMTKY